MLLELTALLFGVSLALLLFGHFSEAWIGFIAGGAMLAFTGSMLAWDGVQTVVNKTEVQGYNTAFTWGYNTTYNFSFFTPSNQSKATVYNYGNMDTKFPDLAWLFIALIGAGYVVAGAAVALSKRD